MFDLPRAWRDFRSFAAQVGRRFLFMATKKIVNKPSSKPKNNGGNPNWKKGMRSPNPAGAPKRGESWADVIKRFGEMTPAEASAHSLELSQKFLSIGEGVTLKQAVILRVYGALLFEPDARLLNAFMDRAEGKVTQTYANVDWRDEARKQGIDPEKLSGDLIDQFTAAMVRAGAGGGVGES